jgi:replication factor A1
MKQVLIPPSTPQNTVTQLRIAPDSLETPPQNISPNKKTSINCEARRALDFEATTQQLRQVYISPYFLYTFFCPWHMLNLGHLITHFHLWKNNGQHPHHPQRFDF